jgi:glycosyltransferase involved in cell wall biosynthesis
MSLVLAKRPLKAAEVGRDDVGADAAGPGDSLDLAIPVFMISFNRGAMLHKVIASMRSLSTPLEIVVHDNGSTEPETLSVLHELEQQGIPVVRAKAITHADELNAVDVTVQRYFAGRRASRYIVTDCDIDMCVADPKALTIYSQLLDAFPKVECVGPMLRIRDIPRSYPLFNHVMNRHIDQFWHQRPSWVETSVGTIAYLDAPIDTTFALHRAGEPFRRLKRGMRVYEPFEALHLDWYGEDQVDHYTKTSNLEISHWNNLSERNLWRNVALRHDRFYAVRRSGAVLVEYEVPIVSVQHLDAAE